MLTDDILYLHCKAGVGAKVNCRLDVLVFDGDLMIVCKNHGPVHIQPYVGPAAHCGAHPSAARGEKETT